MAGTKRAAEDDSGSTTRASKVAKTSASSSKAKKGGKKAAKPVMPATTFKSKALPLHMNLTHTPHPVSDAESETPADPGLIGTFTLVATSFKTGSYGWKGNKRVKIELQGGGDEKETVNVQFTINATVLNSKGADNGAEEKEEKEENGQDEKAEEDRDAEAEEK